MPLTVLEPTAALVVIDLQVGIVTRDLVHPAADVVKRSAELAQAFRAHGRPVVLVNVDAAAPGRTDAGAAAGHRPLPPAGWDQLVPELAAQPTDTLVTKQRPGAFSVHNLKETLDERKVTQIVLTGVATSVGVEATARAAFDLGYHVVLVADAMTDMDPVNHEHSVTRVFPRLGEVTTTDEVLAKLA